MTTQLLEHAIRWQAAGIVAKAEERFAADADPKAKTEGSRWTTATEASRAGRSAGAVGS